MIGFATPRPGLVLALTASMFGFGANVHAQSDVELLEFLETNLSPAVANAEAHQRAGDQMVYLASLFASLPSSQGAAAEAVFATAFGGSYVPGESVLTAVPGYPDVVFGLTSGQFVGAAALTDFTMWELNVAPNPAFPSIPPSAYDVHVYAGRFGDSVTSVGIAARVNFQGLGLPFAQGAGPWDAWNFVPLTLVDSSVIPPATVAEYGALCVNGQIDDYGGTLQFLVQFGEVGSDGGGGSYLARNGLLECLKGVNQTFQQNMDAAGANYAATADPIEDELEDAARGALEATGAGAVGGAIGGASAGAPTVLGAVATTAIGAALGAAGGLISWALFSPSDEEIAAWEAALEAAKNTYKNDVCNAVNQAKNQIIECFQTHDPENLEAAQAVAGAWAASKGC